MSKLKYKQTNKLMNERKTKNYIPLHTSYVGGIKSLIVGFVMLIYCWYSLAAP